MKRTIVALKGPQRSGKSTTLRLVYDRLCDEAGDDGGVIYHPPKQKEARGSIVVVDGVRIGIVSLGDDPTWIEFLVGEMVRLKCMVIVCAARSKQDGTESVTMRAVNSFRRQFKVVWIDKVRGADHASADQMTADKIIQEVSIAIENAQPVPV